MISDSIPFASCGLRPPGQQVARATRKICPTSLLTLVFLLVLLFSLNHLEAQTTDVPVAQPASTPATPTPAQPVDQTASTNAAPGGIVALPAPGAKFDAAMASYNAGQYADAVTAFSDFISAFPQDRHREEALYRLAESYRNLNHADDALAAYTFQVQSYPDGPLRVTAELRRGAILYDKGKLDDAIAPLEYVVNKGDGELQEAAKYLLGHAFLTQQKEADGRALLQDLVDQQPPGKFAGNAAQALAELDDSQGKYPEALALWQKALAYSNDPLVQATAAARGGWSALQSNQLADAENFFNKAIVLNGQNKGDTLKVAATGVLRLRFQQKRYADWVTFYQTYKDNLLDSARAEILYDLGQAQFSLKHWPEAVAGFDQYLKEFGTQDSAVTAAYERFLAFAQIDRAKTTTEADAYLQAYPQSPYRNQVQLLKAQELSREKKFTEALPIWENLAAVQGNASWPHQEILLDLARTYDQLNDFPKAATAYQAYLDDLTTHPASDKTSRAQVQAQARLAVCLQKSGQLLAATEAWKAVQSLAPDGTPEQQTALESLGLIYARGGPPQEQLMLDTFSALLSKYPQSKLRAMAAFSLGDAFFKKSDYAAAEPLLLNSRDWDAKTWMQLATQRLVLGAYGQKNYEKTLSYLKEYDTLPVPPDAQSQIAARLPAAIFYWLGETALKAGNLSDAETDYMRVTQHPDPGDLLAGAWWQLGQVQSERKEWPAAVASYEKYRQMKPDAKDATIVLLAEGRAQLGAQNFDAAKELGNQALLQEPEGPNSAAARTLVAETSYATQNYPEAARMFATLAVLFDDPKITPQAMSRAADAFEKAGDAKSAADQRAKLKEKYPQFQPSPYL